MNFDDFDQDDGPEMNKTVFGGTPVVNPRERITAEDAKEAVPTQDQPTEDEDPGATMIIESPFAALNAKVPRLTLTVIRGNDKNRQFSFDSQREFTIGRSLECDAPIADQAISRWHFKVLWDGKVWILEDLGSGNGTTVDKKKITRVELADKMEIGLGLTVIGVSIAGHSDGKTLEVDDQDDLQLAQTMIAQSVDQYLPPKRPDKADPAYKELHPAESPVIEFPADGYSAGMSGRTKLILAGMVVIFAGVIGYIGVVTFWDDGLGNQSQSADVVGGDGQVNVDQGASLLEKARSAISKKDWDFALINLEEIRKLSLTNPPEGLESLCDLARREQSYRKEIDNASALMDAGDHSGAIASCAKIPETSSYFTKAAEIAEQTNDRYIDTETAQIRSALDSKDFESAKQRYVSLAGQFPEDVRVIALRSDLIKSGIRPPPPARVTSRQGDSDDHSTTDNAKQQMKPVKQNKKANAISNVRRAVEQALALYNESDFNAAHTLIARAADGVEGPDASKARELAALIRKFETAWETGRKALESKKLDEAETQLSRALQFDYGINGHFHGQIRDRLGDLHRAKAAYYLQNADYANSASSARKAIGFVADDALAKGILQKCQSRALDFFKEGERLVNSEPEGARKRLRMVLDIVDTADPLRARANELLSQIK